MPWAETERVPRERRSAPINVVAVAPPPSSRSVGSSRSSSAFRFFAAARFFFMSFPMWMSLGMSRMAIPSPTARKKYGVPFLCRRMPRAIATIPATRRSRARSAALGKREKTRALIPATTRRAPSQEMLACQSSVFWIEISRRSWGSVTGRLIWSEFIGPKPVKDRVAETMQASPDAR